MAYSITTAGTTLTKLGKQVHAGVFKGFAKRSETIKLFKQLKDFELSPSQRTVTATLDLIEQPSGAFISEGGYEADPKTSAPVDATFTWANYSDRWSFTKTSEYLDKKHRDGQLLKNAKYQTMKMIEGMCRRVGIAFYGISSGVLCQTSTDTTSAGPQNYALEDGFDQGTIDDTTYLASLFVAGDRVALKRGGGLVTGSTGGLVNSVSASTGINVTWGASVDADANDQIMFSNSSLSNSGTGLAYTDHDKAPFGLTEMATATSLHGVSGSTYPKWNAALADTAGGDLTGTRLKKGQHEITFDGGGKANLLIAAPGVARRMYQITSNAVQFNDPLGMEILGSVSTKGIKQHTEDPLCPPGWAFLLDDRSFFKWSLVDIPSEDATDLASADNTSIDKLQDINGSVFSFDLPFNFFCKNRGNLAYWNGLSEA